MEGTVEILFGIVYTEAILTIADFQKRGKYYEEKINELQLLRTQQTLAEQQKKLAKDGYLPTLALTGNWTYSAFTDKIEHWFHSGESNHWYKSNGIGISLRIPVFDGFEKRSKIRKAQVDVDNAKLQYENALKGMQTKRLYT